MNAKPSNPATTASPATATTRLRPATGHLIVWGTYLATLVVGGSAAIMSFDGLHRLAVADAGVTGLPGYLLPVVIDGVMVVGSLGTLHAAVTELSARMAWLLVGLGVTASVVGNMASADTSLTARLVAAGPPIAYALTLETTIRLWRYRASLPALQRSRRRKAAIPAAVASAAPMAAPVSPAPVPTPKPRRPAPAGRGSTRERVASILAAHPETSASAIARDLGVDASYARRLVRDIRTADTDTNMLDLPLRLRLAANDA